MIEQNETHNKIVQILEEKGPSLPIQLAKEIGMSSLFISAFLSELTNEKRIKVSHLKMGGSPLYYLQDQEEQLEKFHKYLHPKEAEAFILLKTNKILKDSEQEPAIRVALRSIRDFSVGFKKNEEIYWKYILIPESDINEILSPKQIKKEIPIKQEIIEPDPEPIAPILETPQAPEVIQNQFHNPLAIQPKTSMKKEKPKSEFIQKIINRLNNNYKIIEEKEYKPKEYNCLLQVNSDLGPINFLTQAKDKKSVSETDLKKLLSAAQAIPLPALFIYTGKLSKKAQEYTDKYSSILKTLKTE